MKSHCHHLCRLRRSITYCLLLLVTILLMPPASFGKVKAHAAAAPDTPSGLSWGIISYLAGGGTLNPPGLIPNGTLANQLYQFGGYIVAADSQGNIYAASGGDIGTSGSISIIPAQGAKVPPLLAAVTTNASPAIQPVPGGVYQVAGSDSIDCTNGGSGPFFCHDGGTALQATFGPIEGMSFDGQGNLYIVDGAGAIRRIANSFSDLSASTAVTTVAGTLNTPGVYQSTIPQAQDDVPATGTIIGEVSDVRVDAGENIYLIDTYNAVVQVVYGGGAGGSVPNILTAEKRTPTAGNIYIVGGSQAFCGSPGTCGNGGPALAASFYSPEGIEVDSNGNIYLSDSYIQIVGVIYAGVAVPPILTSTLASGTSPASGDFYEIAGQEFINCTTAPCGDGTPALKAQLNEPYYLHVDASGNLYLADLTNQSIRKVDESGYISASAGVENPGSPSNPSTGNGGPADGAMFNGLSDFAIDANSNLYVSDANFIWQAPQAVAAKPQTVDFPALAPIFYGTAALTLDTAVALDASNNPTGLPITYTIVSGPGYLAPGSSSLEINGVGSIVIAASQAGTLQYSPATAQQTLVVNPAPLTVTAANASITFGSPVPALTYQVTGFVLDETPVIAGVTGSVALQTTAVLNSPVGSYPITFKPGSDTLAAPNYVFSTFVPGTLQITGNFAQTIKFAALAPFTYGQATTLTLAATATSALPVSFGVNSGPAQTSGPNNSILTITGAGTISITATQAGGGQYAAAPPITQTLVVNPALLTVTAPAVTLTYGTVVNPANFPFPVITGFVGTDTAASVTGNAAYTTPVAGTTPAAGTTYSIQASVGGLALLPGVANNYIFSNFLPGKLTIVQAAQAITFNTLTALIYGSSETVNAASQTSLTANNLPVTVTVTGPGAFVVAGVKTTSYILDPASSGTTVPLQGTGVGSLTITAAQAGSGNYAPAAPVTQTISVGQAALNISAYPPQIREEGAQNPLLFPYILGNASGGPGGFVNGDTDVPSVITGVPLLTTVATPASLPGVYPIVVTQGTLVATNYYFNFINGLLTVTPPGSFTVTSNPSSLTIQSGLSGQATLTITPQNAYVGTVTLSCGLLPANVGCQVSPSTVTFTGPQDQNGSENPAQATVTVLASGATVVGALRGRTSISEASMLLVPGALAGLMLAFVRRRASRRSGVWGLILLIAAAAGMLGVSSCGGSSHSLLPASGTAAITINASGTSVTGGQAVTSTATLNVTIQ